MELDRALGSLRREIRSNAARAQGSEAQPRYSESNGELTFRDEERSWWVEYERRWRERFSWVVCRTETIAFLSIIRSRGNRRSRTDRPSQILSC